MTRNRKFRLRYRLAFDHGRFGEGGRLAGRFEEYGA